MNLNEKCYFGSDVDFKYSHDTKTSDNPTSFHHIYRGKLPAGFVDRVDENWFQCFDSAATDLSQSRSPNIVQQFGQIESPDCIPALKEPVLCTPARLNEYPPQIYETPVGYVPVQSPLLRLTSCLGDTRSSTPHTLTNHMILDTSSNMSWSSSMATPPTNDVELTETNCIAMNNEALSDDTDYKPMPVGPVRALFGQTEILDSSVETEGMECLNYSQDSSSVQLIHTSAISDSDDTNPFSCCEYVPSDNVLSDNLNEIEIKKRLSSTGSQDEGCHEFVNDRFQDEERTRLFHLNTDGRLMEVSGSTRSVSPVFSERTSSPVFGKGDEEVDDEDVICPSPEYARKSAFDHASKIEQRRSCDTDETIDGDDLDTIEPTQIEMFQPATSNTRNSDRGEEFVEKFSSKFINSNLVEMIPDSNDLQDSSPINENTVSQETEVDSQKSESILANVFKSENTCCVKSWQNDGLKLSGDETSVAVSLRDLNETERSRSFNDFEENSTEDIDINTKQDAMNSNRTNCSSRIEVRETTNKVLNIEEALSIFSSPPSRVPIRKAAPKTKRKFRINESEQNIQEEKTASLNCDQKLKDEVDSLVEREGDIKNNISISHLTANIPHENEALYFTQISPTLLNAVCDVVEKENIQSNRIKDTISSVVSSDDADMRTNSTEARTQVCQKSPADESNTEFNQSQNATCLFPILSPSSTAAMVQVTDMVSRGVTSLSRQNSPNYSNTRLQRSSITTPVRWSKQDPIHQKHRTVELEEKYNAVQHEITKNSTSDIQQQTAVSSLFKKKKKFMYPTSKQISETCPKKVFQFRSDTSDVSGKSKVSTDTATILSDDTITDLSVNRNSTRDDACIDVTDTDVDVARCVKIVDTSSKKCRQQNKTSEFKTFSTYQRETGSDSFENSRERFVISGLYRSDHTENRNLESEVRKNDFQKPVESCGGFLAPKSEIPVACRSNDVPLGGFTSGNGKNLIVSTKALQSASHLFADIDEISLGDSTTVSAGVSMKKTGISTGNRISSGIAGDEDIQKNSGCSVENDDIPKNFLQKPTYAEVNSFGGFTTGNGKKLSVSDNSLKKASVLLDEAMNDNVCKLDDVKQPIIAQTYDDNIIDEQFESFLSRLKSNGKHQSDSHRFKPPKVMKMSTEKREIETNSTTRDVRRAEEPAFTQFSQERDQCFESLDHFTFTQLVEITDSTSAFIQTDNEMIGFTQECFIRRDTPDRHGDGLSDVVRNPTDENKNLKYLPSCNEEDGDSSDRRAISDDIPDSITIPDDAVSRIESLNSSNNDETLQGETGSNDLVSNIRIESDVDEEEFSLNPMLKELTDSWLPSSSNIQAHCLQDSLKTEQRVHLNVKLNDENECEVTMEPVSNGKIAVETNDCEMLQVDRSGDSGNCRFSVPTTPAAKTVVSYTAITPIINQNDSGYKSTSTPIVDKSSSSAVNSKTQLSVTLVEEFDTSFNPLISPNEATRIDETNDTRENSLIGVCDSFQTASGWAVGYSDESMCQAVKLFDDIYADKSELSLNCEEFERECDFDAPSFGCTQKRKRVDSNDSGEQSLVVGESRIGERLTKLQTDEKENMNAEFPVDVVLEESMKPRKLFPDENKSSEIRNSDQSVHNVRKNATSVVHFAGFSTAGGKTMTISEQSLKKARSLFTEEDKPTESVTPKQFGGFSTAGGKTVTISGESLKKARSLFTEEDKPTESVTPKQFGGFSTAGGKTVTISGESLKKARSLFTEEDKPTESVTPKQFGGFSTAGGKTVTISGESLKKARSLFTEEDKPTESVTPKQFGGFSTAGGKTVTISGESLKKARSLFTEEDKPTESVTPKQFGGFSTAGGKIVTISGESLKKARSLFTEEDKPTESVTPKQFGGFSTAGGKTVTISGESLKKARSLFTEEDKPTESVTPKQFGGFSTAGGKTVTISGESLKKARSLFTEEDKPTESVTPKQFGGFSTAGGKIVTISGESLKKARSLFTEEDKPTESVTPKQFGGFSTAGGKTVTISGESLKKARSLFTEEDKPTESVTPKQFGGFSTAGGKTVTISEQSLKKARSLFTEEDKPTDSMTPKQFGGFSTAGGKTVTISGESLKKARSLFTEEDKPTESVTPKQFGGFSTAGGKTVTISEQSLKKARSLFTEEDKPTDSMTPKQFGGFSTAGGKTVTISGESLKKARSLFTEEDKPTESVTPKQFGGFSTAGGKTVNISEQSLKKARSLFTEEDKPTESVTPKQFGGFSTAGGKTVTISGESLKKARSLFTEEQSPEVQTIQDLCDKTDSQGFDGLCSDKAEICKIPSQNPRLHKSDDKEEDVMSKEIRESSLALLADGEFDEIVYVKRTPTRPWMKPHSTTPEGVSFDRDICKNTACRSSPLDTKSNSSMRWLGANSYKAYNDSKAWKNDRPTILKPSQKTPQGVQKPFTKTCESSVKTPAKPSTFINPIKSAHSPCETQTRENRKTQTTKPVSSSSFISPVKPSTFISPVKVQTQENSNAIQESNRKRPLSNSEESSNKRLKVNNLKAETLTVDNTEYSVINDEILCARQEARFGQELKIKKKKRLKIQALPGKLWSKKRTFKRINLQDVVNGGTPGCFTKDQLYRCGIHSSTTEITCESSASYEFIAAEHYSKTTLRDSGCVFVKLGDGAELIWDNRSHAGVQEFTMGFMAMNGVDPNLISKEWVANHYQWIVWKLAAQEVAFPYQFAGRRLTPDQVMLELKYRYDREIDHSHRSALKKIMERDDTSTKTLILCVSKIINFPSETVSSGVIELTDGWYKIPALLDKPLTSLVETGRISIGQKLCISGAELIGSQDACSPLEAPADLMLKICANSCRRARWNTKLGFYRNPQPIAVPLTSLFTDGGLVGCVDIVITRVYPIQYMDKHVDGSTTFRNERSEEKAKRQYERSRQSRLEKLYNDLQKKFEIGETPRRRNRTNRRFTDQQINELQSGQDIFEALEEASDPSAIEVLLNEYQHQQLDEYRRKLQEEKQCELQVQLQQQLHNKQDDKELLNRQVTPLLKIRVAGYSMKDVNYGNANTFLCIWRPSEDVVHLLQEGKRLKAYHLATSLNRCRQTCGLDVQLTATRSTKYQQITVDETIVDSIYEPRSILPLNYLLSMPEAPLYGEVDIVGIVFNVQRCNPPNAVTVYLADVEENIVEIKFWNGIHVYSLEDVLVEGNTVAAVNLQCNRIQGRIAALIPSEISHFTTKPKHSYLQTEIQRNFLRPVQCRQFVKKVQAKLELLLSYNTTGHLQLSERGSTVNNIRDSSALLRPTETNSPPLDLEDDSQDRSTVLQSQYHVPENNETIVNKPDTPIPNSTQFNEKLEDSVENLFDERPVNQLQVNTSLALTSDLKNSAPKTETKVLYPEVNVEKVSVTNEPVDSDKILSQNSCPNMKNDEKRTVCATEFISQSWNSTPIRNANDLANLTPSGELNKKRMLQHERARKLELFEGMYGTPSPLSVNYTPSPLSNNTRRSFRAPGLRSSATKSKTTSILHNIPTCVSQEHVKLDSVDDKSFSLEKQSQLTVDSNKNSEGNGVCCIEISSSQDSVHDSCDDESNEQSSKRTRLKRRKMDKPSPKYCKPVNQLEKNNDRLSENESSQFSDNDSCNSLKRSNRRSSRRRTSRRK